MTILDRRPRRPLPRPASFSRIRRADFEEHSANLEKQRDRAIGRERARRQWVASLLEQRADWHDNAGRDAATPPARRAAHRMTTDDLRGIANDIEEGPSQ
jgi:hypothetical protein